LKKAWTAPDGSCGLIPKDEGLGVMLSAFVSREFGFGMKLSQEELIIVNRFRACQENKLYKDTAAANDKLGSDLKAELTESPFVKEFEYGASDSAKGYWCYEWMHLQLEDCVDVIQALYLQFDFVFMVNHSCGHDRKRPDGLSANEIRKGFGGAQAKMRSTKILHEEQLGSYDRLLAVNDTQIMVFDGTGQGPCWLTEADRILKKFDREDQGGGRCDREIQVSQG
jgi:hypothetical protein